MTKAPTATPAPAATPGPTGTAAPTTAAPPLNLEKLTLDVAMAYCKAHPAAAAELFMSVLGANTASLPGTIFVKRDEGVFLKKYRVAVRLTERDKHLVGMKIKVDNGRGGKDEVMSYTPTLNGLRKLNEVASLLVLRPDRVFVEGREQGNPYMQIHEKTRLPEVAYARSVVVGYSPFGSLIASDVMVRLDANLYLLENIQAKVSYMGNDGKRLAQYGTPDQPPLGDDQKPLPGRWTFMFIHSVGDIGLWLNLQATEAQNVLKDHSQRLKFLDRLAQSFSERNALRAHPSIPNTINAVSAAGGGVASVSVHGWTSDFDRADIDRLRDLIQKGKLEDFRDRSGKAMQVSQYEPDLTPEDAAALQADVSEHAAVDPAGGTPAVEEGEGENQGDADAGGGETEAGPPDEVALMNAAAERYSDLVTAKGPGAAKQALREVGIEIIDEATPDQLQKFLNAAKI